MPDQLTSAGLEVKTVQEVIDSLAAGLRAVYGSDINVDPSSPDGQMINIFAQSGVDLRELLVNVYNTFAVDNAYGTILDARVALNGLARQAGTFTTTDMEITVDRALTLPGLDAAITDPDGAGFTVADATGNQFILAATQVIAAPGTYTYSFRAKDLGAVETTPNTITNQVTVTLGVTAVNNPAALTSLGENEETDAELKLRHARSFFLAATGPADAVEAALQAIPEVTDAFVAQNDTAGVLDGVPAHGIWTIVENGSDADVAQAIYAKKGLGCAMRGAVTYDVVRPNGTTFTAKFDRPIAENLYLKFTLVPRRAGVTFDLDLIKTQLITALAYGLNQSANIGDIVLAMFTIAPLGVLTSIGVSDDGITYADTLAPTDYQHKFALDAARIDITV